MEPIHVRRGTHKDNCDNRSRTIWTPLTSTQPIFFIAVAFTKNVPCERALRPVHIAFAIYLLQQMGCAELSTIVAIAPFEHFLWIPYNPLVAIKKSQSQWEQTFTDSSKVLCSWSISNSVISVGSVFPKIGFYDNEIFPRGSGINRHYLAKQPIYGNEKMGFIFPRQVSVCMKTFWAMLLMKFRSLFERIQLKCLTDIGNSNLHHVSVLVLPKSKSWSMRKWSSLSKMFSYQYIVYDVQMHLCLAKLVNCNQILGDVANQDYV